MKIVKKKVVKKKAFKKEDIVAALKEGAVAVKFTKVDGTERLMNCTLNSKALPVLETKTSADNQHTPNDAIVNAWDLDKSGWRSFRVANVVEYSPIENMVL